MITTLVDAVSRAARRWPERTAWIFDETGERLSFTDVDRRTSSLASALAALEVGAGDHVALMMRNRPEFPLVWLALAKLGAVAVPLNVGYRTLDGAHVLSDSGARLVVADAEFVPLLESLGADRVVVPSDLDGTARLREPYAPVPEQPMNIQYTSGTTGAPKGCVLPHRYWTTFAHGMVHEFPRINSLDTIVTAQPFHYVDPQWNVVLGLVSGATLVVLDRFHPTTFWSKVREYGVTWFYCLGMMPTLLLRQPPSRADRDHRVRAVHASGIPRSIHSALEDRFGAPWYEAFGMTETCSDLRVSEPDHDEVVGTGCIGTPVFGREAVVLSVSGEPAPRGATGELCVRGVGLMHGYHNNPAATDNAFRGGWFHTGDLVRMDEKGRVFHVGRIKDMIRRSGENISADEVERALLEHDNVRLAAVIGVPDDIRGEEIRAFIVPADPSTVDPEALVEHCADKLAAFKIPRYFTFVDELPMTPSERVAKGELRAVAANLDGSYDRAAGAWL